MKRLFTFITAPALALSLFAAPDAQAGGKMMKMEGNIKTMPAEAQIKVARSAAPEAISKDASIMIFGPDGKLTEAKKGTNGFTCIPDIDEQEKPDPFCGDAAAMQWVEDLVAGKPSPSNDKPGIAYMMQGGWHWEKDGKVVMNQNVPGAKRVVEPPHWMVFWPFSASESYLPTVPGKFGTYIMWDSTPYAHLMIYQDPKSLE